MGLVDLQRRCKNYSFATVRCVPRIDRNGFDVALAVAKLTYAVDPLGNVTLVPSQHYWDDVHDGHGGVRYPQDFAEEKPGTDVGLVGNVVPSRVIPTPTRGAEPTQQLVWLQVAGYRKAATVFGARTYQVKGAGVAPGPADPLRPFPLVHGFAWGGTDLLTKSAHPANPAGRGFADEPLSLAGQPAHRIEPVQDPSGLSKRIEPWHASFGPISPWWEPRQSRIGTHDYAWSRDRAPIRPVDFDPLHHAWAVPDLHFDQPLAADAPIEIGGMTPEGVWRFRLPAYAIAFSTREIGAAAGGEDEVREIPAHLDSMLIDAEERKVELSWRAAVRLPRKWELMPTLVIYGVGELPDAVVDPTLGGTRPGGPEPGGSRPEASPP